MYAKFHAEISDKRPGGVCGPGQIVSEPLINGLHFRNKITVL